ncbi:MAG: D-isomer specific 2-hydroxyacid dehydrogenase NAD binding domain protein [Puniceicoccaceae bacterium 5H]|nr:MAG: D-isomer specific 2-hydroxyacid dehydrogenase NAD binding domain protein [Puniceicoccaceae bacterium 5H]
MSNTILYALTDVEWQTFFPGKMRDEVTGLAENAVVVDPLSFDAETWEQQLSETKPDILVACWKTPALPENLQKLTDGKLQYVCYLSGSVRKLLTAEHIDDGLTVTNWGNSISRTVAECGLMLGIACMRRASYWTIGMHRANAWKTPETITGSLFERRIGLHGFGSISRELVKLLQPFDTQISTYSPRVPDALLEEFNVSRADTLESLFADNDIIFELAALTPENTGIVTEELLRSIPEGGAFINIGRGAVVDEEALARVAADGKIQVGLDVYGKEPLPKDSPFRQNDAVMTLPHLSGPTTDRRQDCGRLAIQNIKAYQNGGELESVVTVSVYQRAS